MDHDAEYEAHLKRDYERWEEMPVPEGFDPETSVAAALGIGADINLPVAVEDLPADVREWLAVPAVEGLAWMKVRETFDLITDDRVDRLARAAAEYRRRRSSQG